jgi:hypothetical protein
MLSESVENKSEENENVKLYLKDAEKAFAQIELVSLAEDGAVRIKLNDEQEIIYKSPKELFMGADYADEKLREITDEFKRETFRGVHAPFVFSWRFKYTDFDSLENIEILKKDLEIGYIIASQGVNPEMLDIFAGKEDKNDQDEDDIFFERDGVFKTIVDRNISDNVRIINFYETTIRGGNINGKQIDYFLKIQKENPEFMDKFIDFSVRRCLTSSHEWSLSLFQLVKAFPAFYERLSQAHKDFSLPYLFERDYYGRWATEKGEDRKQKYKTQYSEVFSESHMNIKKIRQTLTDLENDRDYCPGFFEE